MPSPTQKQLLPKDIIFLTVDPGITSPEALSQDRTPKPAETVSFGLQPLALPNDQQGTQRRGHDFTPSKDPEPLKPKKTKKPTHWR